MQIISRDRIIRELRDVLRVPVFHSNDYNAFKHCLLILGDKFVGQYDHGQFNIYVAMPNDLIPVVMAEISDQLPYTKWQEEVLSCVGRLSQIKVQAMDTCQNIVQVFNNLKQEADDNIRAHAEIEASARESVRRRGY